MLCKALPTKSVDEALGERLLVVVFSDMLDWEEVVWAVLAGALDDVSIELVMGS